MASSAIVNYFNQFILLTEEEIARVHKVFTEKTIKRRAYILQEGDICKHNTFVVKGCLKMYLNDSHGKSHNLVFAIENWWASDINSLNNNTPTQLNIQALETSEVLQINQKDLEQLFIDFPRFNYIFRVITESALAASQQRVLHNISSTAEERYLDFIQRYPSLVNRISNVQIASYLGVTPEFLSGVRKKISLS